MKYKTLFRLLVKVLGLWLVVQGVAGCATGITQFLGYLSQAWSGGMSISSGLLWVGGQLLGSGIEIAAGLYLFIGGAWIINMAIPSNRPHCPECGYPLRELTGPSCPECGTAIPASA